MKTRWQALRAKYWSARPQSERKILLLAAALLLPVSYYFLLWQPAHQALAKLHTTLPSLRAQANKLSAQAAEVEMLRHRPQLASLDASSLKTSIEASALRHQLRPMINTLETQEPNGVRISCEAIPFAAWLNWMRELQQEQHILAESVSISALPQPGLVKISATLTSGNAQ